MMNTIENPKLSISDLNRLEDLVKNNTAKVEDYELMDNYLTFLGINDFFLTKLKENDIEGYADFIYRRKSGSSSTINLLVGTALGVLSVLRKHILGKL
jgi:hypothetical protein